MNHSRCLTLFCSLLLSMAGCQQSITDRLMGEWVGTPDTATAAAERSAKLKSKEAENGEAEEASLPAGEEAATSRGKTDLEQHDVTIELNFTGRHDVHMEIAQGGLPLNGSWRVVQTLPPRGAEIEIRLEQKSAKKSAQSKPTEKRRFVVDFQGDGSDAGFTLVEKGADPQFGRLFFERKR